MRLFDYSLRRSAELIASALAIDQVFLKQNTSALPDEFVAHRLGMIPLISNNVKNTLRPTRVCPRDFCCCHSRALNCFPPGMLVRRGL